MTDLREDIGYIKASMEANSKAIAAIKEDVADMRKQLSLYRHVIMFVKALGWVALLIITLKMGDIPDKWLEVWK